jgi:hypothetical protein
MSRSAVVFPPRTDNRRNVGRNEIRSNNSPESTRASPAALDSCDH